MIKQLASITALSTALCAMSAWSDPLEEIVSGEFSLRVMNVEHDENFRTGQDPELAPHGAVMIAANACYTGDEPRTDPFYRMTSINVRQGLAGTAESDMYSLEPQFRLLPNERGPAGGVGSEGPFGPMFRMVTVYPDSAIRQQRTPMPRPAPMPGPQILWSPGDCNKVQFMAFLQRPLRRLTFRLDVVDVLDNVVVKPVPSQEVAMCLDALDEENFELFVEAGCNNQPLINEIENFCGETDFSYPGCMNLG